MNTYNSLYAQPLFELPQIDGVKIIGFGHKARHGKDHAAKILLDIYGSQARVFSCADALKAFCRVNYGMTIKDGSTLQQVGQSMRTKYGDVWERALYWTIDEQRPRIAIVPDVRHKQEAKFLKYLGGTLIKVSRVREDGVTPFISPDRNPDHPSERQLDDYEGWDRTIVNVSDKRDDFEVRVRAMAKEIIGAP